VHLFWQELLKIHPPFLPINMIVHVFMSACVCLSIQEGPKEAFKLTQAEERATGRVDVGVYLRYFRSWGRGYWVPGALVLLAFMERGLQVGGWTGGEGFGRLRCFHGSCLKLASAMLLSLLWIVQRSQQASPRPTSSSSWLAGRPELVAFGVV
jgi:hypothetical protein